MGYSSNTHLDAIHFSLVACSLDHWVGTFCNTHTHHHHFRRASLREGCEMITLTSLRMFRQLLFFFLLRYHCQSCNCTTTPYSRLSSIGRNTHPTSYYHAMLSIMDSSGDDRVNYGHTHTSALLYFLLSRLPYTRGFRWTFSLLGLRLYSTCCEI